MKRISQNHLMIIASNLLPLMGVVLLGWDPFSVFGLYILETIIIGLFHAVKMLYLMNSNELDTSPVKAKEGVNQLPPSPLFLIPFFLFHFMFFVFVQTIIVFSFGSDGFFSAFEKLLEYTQGEYRWVLGSIIGLHLLAFSNDVFLQRKYKGKQYGKVFMEPYPRIFIQQFVVIMGSFFVAVTGSGIPLVIIFVLVKIIAEIFVEEKGGFDNLMNNAEGVNYQSKQQD